MKNQPPCCYLNTNYTVKNSFMAYILPISNFCRPQISNNTSNSGSPETSIPHSSTPPGVLLDLLLVCIQQSAIFDWFTLNVRSNLFINIRTSNVETTNPIFTWKANGSLNAWKIPNAFVVCVLCTRDTKRSTKCRSALQVLTISLVRLLDDCAPLT